ncbi:MAG TPA: hypothetical protein VD793_01825 [Gemmatimonadales bacterium]|nr:hypothetical protein [Gemmatimonadales bacterium]
MADLPTAPSPGTRERVRFAAFDFKRSPSGACHARVVLEWQPGDPHVGETDGVSSPAGALRCAAQAAVIALESAIERRLRFELLGVKSLRAFDANVIIVSLTTQGEGPPRRIVGSYLAEDDLERGAALAVLHATNRVLGNLFARIGLP